MLLTQRLAVVTGADCAIGADIVLALADAGADVAAVVSAGASARGWPRPESAQVVLECTPNGDRDVDRMMADLASRTGCTADILVNLTGFAPPPRTPIWQMSVEAYDAEFEGSLRQAFLFMRHFLPGMVSKRKGRVINVGRIDGHRGAEGHSAAGAMGWALRGLTRSAALEAGQAGVTINLVACGPLDGDDAEQKMRDGFVAGSALGNATSGRDIGQAVVFLSSGMADHITGQELVVDGGVIV